MFDTITVGILVGILVATPMSDSQASDVEFVRIGKNSVYDIAVDTKSIKVNWGNGEMGRIVNVNMKFTPITEEFLVLGARDWGVSSHIISTETKCDSRQTVFVTKVRSYSLQGHLIDYGEWAGPISEWKNFGIRPALELGELFCGKGVSRKKLGKPAMV